MHFERLFWATGLQILPTLRVVLLHLRQLVRNLILSWIQSTGILPRRQKIMMSNLPPHLLLHQKMIQLLNRLAIRSNLILKSLKTIFQMWHVIQIQSIVPIVKIPFMRTSLRTPMLTLNLSLSSCLTLSTLSAQMITLLLLFSRTSLKSLLEKQGQSQTKCWLNSKKIHYNLFLSALRNLSRMRVGSPIQEIELLRQLWRSQKFLLNLHLFVLQRFFPSSSIMSRNDNIDQRWQTFRVRRWDFLL